METIDRIELDKIKAILSKTNSQGISIAYEPADDSELDEIKLNLDYIKKELKDYNVSYIYGGNITIFNIEQYNREKSTVFLSVATP